jgi:hypothetical protein
MLYLIFFVSDEGLKKDDLLLRGWVTNSLCDLEGLVIITIFVMTLSKIKFVLGDIRIEF